MGRESAGSVYISIDADAAPLIAKFAQTESAARAAGQRIAGGLGRGLQQGSQQLALFNAILQKSQTEEGKTAQAAVQLATALSGVGASAATAQTGIKRWSESVQGLGTDLGAAQAKAQSFVGVIPGLGRAAEHFINLLPGVGTAIMSIFPLLGAIALAENVIPIIGKVAGVFGGLTEQEKKAAEEAKTVAEQIRTIGESIQSIDFKIMEDSLGRTVALAAKAAKATVDAASGPLIARRALFQSQVDEQKNSQTGAEVLEGVANKGDKKPNKALLDQIALIDAQLYELSRHSIEYSKDAMRSEGEDNKKGEAQAKQALADKRQAFRDYYDGQLADMKAAHAVTTAEELAFRKKELTAVQGQGGMAPVERDVRNQVGTLTQERYREIATASKKFEQDQVRDAKQSADIKITVMRGFWADVRAGLDETARDFEREQDQERALIVATVAHENRMRQEQIRATGVRTQSTDEIAGLQIQQAYALQIAHTRGEELQYAKDIAAADEKSLSDRISNLQALMEYQQVNALYDEANRTDLEIERAKSDQKKQQIQDATRLAQLNPRFQLGREIAGIGQRIPGQLGGAIANGATGGGNIGKQVADALRGIGKDLLGATLTAAIQKLIVVTGVEAIATRAMAAIFGTAQITNTAATTANTVATIGQTTAMIATTTANVAGMTALALAVSANTTALLINAFVPKPLGFAAGGRPPVGVPSIIGESGPELFIPDGPGVIIPNVPTSGVSSQNLTASAISNSSSNALSIGALHLHGVHNVEQFARRLPNVLKARAPVFSPATR